MVHGDMPPTNIGYKYNFHKVLYLIDTDGSGRKKYCINYSSNYTDQFANAYIKNVAYTQIRYKLFESVNEIYPQNKSIQSYLALENYWVTKCGWLWLCTKFVI